MKERQPCRAAPCDPDSEEERREDEGFNEKTDLFVETADEEEGKIPLSESHQSFEIKQTRT
ncbi:hypothetical protein EYF80_033647 [Liparis tanakae]|uniref:Uncharacterized protein n=1 Tax=Liparis tanakae TaxID=230148 RepID=A0A4Z2GR95_9TELE|nr:hypothetical protein EYF80_033647 [Liparis tanakae]